MKNFFQKVTRLIVGDDAGSAIVKKTKQSRKQGALTERDLLRLESQVGANLFGAVPKGRRREFFCLDESTWIWHEEWKDEKGIERQSTVRYEVHQNGILKVSDGPRYQYIEGDELKNFAKATRAYYERTAKEVYGRDPATGFKLA